MKKSVFLVGLFVFNLGFISCVHNKSELSKNDHKGGLERYVAQDGEIEPRLIVQTFGAIVTHTKDINLEKWHRGKSRGRKGEVSGSAPNFRAQSFVEMSFANSRDVSLQGKKHEACYLGNPNTIRDRFFNIVGQQNPDPNNKMIFKYKDRTSGQKKETELLVDSISVSTDEKMMGFTFRYADLPERSFHFRMSECNNSGKAPMLDEAKLKDFESFDPSVMEFHHKKTRKPAAAEDGFNIEDVVSDTEIQNRNLPKFELQRNYDQLKSQKEDRPWKGMDISTSDGALKFAFLLQKYAYEGMYDQDSENINKNFIAQNNKKRFWCHMPWLNVGNAGREAIHGLTMERDLAPSTMYPRTTVGSDWGVGFYNSHGCRTIQNVFLDGSDIKEEPDFSQFKFEDGTVSVKILFTTAPSGPGFSLNGAYKWTANISPPRVRQRALGEVSHIQMDIAVKDSTLKGTRSVNDHWVMITYYYDARYRGSVLTKQGEYFLPNLPAGLAKMKPVGVQVGFDKPALENPSSIIFFKDRKGVFLTNNPDGHLNGPADNPKSNCFSCHGSAGVPKLPMVPGVVTDEQYSSVKSRGLDFSQQLALARRNYETRH